jgi:hypothetical protein
MLFSFGESERERIDIDVHGYERDRVGEYWDDNWLNVTVRVQVGGFTGLVAAAIVTSELNSFLSALRILHKELKASAEFTTIEEQLSLRLVGDGKGHIELSGQITDAPGTGNRLNFTLKFDQTWLAKSIRELERVTLEFPVRTV